MKFFKIAAICWCFALAAATTSYAQIVKKTVSIQKINSPIKIDGLINETVWKTAPRADKFIALKPTPFQPESEANASEIYFLYDNDGIYMGGYFHENNKDSIAAELAGRDGFGNNDFVGLVLDTYQDKINGFEYFITPLGEQWDAKATSGNEDFSWNAVWQSAAKIHADGWSFEFFIPYSAIRFGKKKVQDWGLNIVRRRQKSGQQLFWQSIDPTVNGFLTQSGTLTGLEDIKPPLRLQFSPYLSTYLNHDGTAAAGTKKGSATVNGGMDVKYGINQAFTLDMTLIPDFGQVQTDNRILNLSPFEPQYTENRAFFTEGTELFNKGNLFYSRRIGIEPVYRFDPSGPNDSTVESPSTAKIINATKISGRTQKGLGIGMLNAITQPQYAVLYDRTTGEKREAKNMPLTNYNILVLNQSLKHNSSISLVNTNVLRSGDAYDANVTSALFDLNDKKNTWNVGGNFSVSNLISKERTVTGYAHNLYFGKTSGRFNFSIYQDLYTNKYDKSDLGYFTNNNYMEQGAWAGYRWNKPKNWYNQMQLNANFWYSNLVTPIDILKRDKFMFQYAGYNINGNAQTKKLQGFGFNVTRRARKNDFYEARYYGRVFTNTPTGSLSLWYESNSVKKFSWTSSFYGQTGGVFKGKNFEYGISGKIRFNSKFSIEQVVNMTNIHNQAGWAGYEAAGDKTIFSRRDVQGVENVSNLKYSFTNKMGITLRTRHYWSKVTPLQFYELGTDGDLKNPATAFTQDVRKNYNFLSVDMVYNWQFAQGSFFSIVWKDIGEDYNGTFEKRYAKNLRNIFNEKQFNSLSVRVIYFIDYLTVRKKMRKAKV